MAEDVSELVTPPRMAWGGGGTGGGAYSPVPYTPLRREDLESAAVVHEYFRGMLATLSQPEGTSKLATMHQLFLASEVRALW